MPRVAFQTMRGQAIVPEPNGCTVSLPLELSEMPYNVLPQIFVALIICHIA